jgi:hypothetical protein
VTTSRPFVGAGASPFSRYSALCCGPDFRDDSDIDILLTFREGVRYTLFDIVRLDVMWETMQRDVPLLLAQLEALVPS